LAILQNVKRSYSMTQQFYSRVYVQNKWKQMSTPNLHMNIRAALFILAQMVEATQPFINWRIDKQNPLSPHNGRLFRNKRKWSTRYATTWMSFENIMLNERSKSLKTTCCMIALVGNVQNRQMHRESRLAVVRGWQ
jgi:hypothetical protein